MKILFVENFVRASLPRLSPVDLIPLPEPGSQHEAGTVRAFSCSGGTWQQIYETA